MRRKVFEITCQKGGATVGGEVDDAPFALMMIIVGLLHSYSKVFTYSPTHSLTYIHTYLLTYSLTHSLTHSLTLLLTYSLTHLLTHSLTHSPIG